MLLLKCLCFNAFFSGDSKTLIYTDSVVLMRLKSVKSCMMFGLNHDFQSYHTLTKPKRLLDTKKMCK